MGFLCAWDQIQSFWSQSFARKDISCHARNRLLDKNCFQTVTIFFDFFLQHVSLTLFHLCPRRFWKVLLALIRGGTSKSRIFEKIYTLSQVSFQLYVEHPLRMQASSRFWLR